MNPPPTDETGRGGGGWIIVFIAVCHPVILFLHSFPQPIKVRREKAGHFRAYPYVPFHPVQKMILNEFDTCVGLKFFRIYDRLALRQCIYLPQNTQEYTRSGLPFKQTL